jgi:dihydroorotase
MKILIQKALIVNSASPHHLQKKDLLFEDGLISDISNNITGNADRIINADGASLSPGFVDIFSFCGDPGLEYKENFESYRNAARAGGYCKLMMLPNTNPVIDNKSQVAYINHATSSGSPKVYPLGALTKQAAGRELAEMYDMSQSGAVAFTDGLHPVQDAGLLLKALQYVKSFDGVVIQVPIDQSISRHGLMHEGIVSTRLGLPGLPAMAEEIMVARDIKLSRYADSHIHFTGVSSAKSLEYIARAKEGGLKVTCSVTPYHLHFCDEDLAQYDTNFKLNPPLRSRQDRDAIKNAVLSGLVDCIASHHLPHEWDSKTIEFEYAQCGMTGLQTTFSSLVTALPQLSCQQTAALLGENARKIFKLPADNIEVGSQPAMTLWNTAGSFMLTRENNLSLNTNCAFMDLQLQGVILETFN